MKLFLLAILATAGSVLAEVHNQNSRIIDGELVPAHGFPFMVYVRNEDFGCGGTIIREDAVLTSAQCVRNMSKIDIWAGVHNIYILEATLQRIWSREIITHENWTESNPNLYDIAIILLNKNLTFNAEVSSITLAPDESVRISGFQSIYAKVTGWGRWFTAKHRTELRFAEGFIVSQRLCVDHCGVPDHNTLLCFHNYWDKKLKIGDAGGPAMEETDDGRYYQLGIYSYIPEEKCKREGQMTLFTRVSQFVDWINSKLPTYA